MKDEDVCPEQREENINFPQFPFFSSYMWKMHKHFFRVEWKFSVVCSLMMWIIFVFFLLLTAMKAILQQEALTVKMLKKKIQWNCWKNSQIKHITVSHLFAVFSIFHARISAFFHIIYHINFHFSRKYFYF